MILLLFVFVLAAAAGTGNDGSEPTVKNIGKEFLFTGHISEVSTMEPDVAYSSADQKRFGVQWNIRAIRNRNGLGLYLVCHNHQEREDKKWSVKVSVQMQLTSARGNTWTKSVKHNFDGENPPTEAGWKDYIPWNHMMKSFVSNDTLPVEVRVKILEMAGIGKKKLMSFDTDRKEFSDVVLVVEDRKFYVSKLFLASQSPFFEDLFLRDSEESQKPEITLSGSDAFDFQYFLELLHGENPIDDSTIEGIVHLAHKYNVSLAIQKCEKFLIKKSKKDLKDKLQLAYRYSLDSLRDHCLSQITSEADLISFVANGTSEMDPFVVRDMLEKLLVFHAELSKIHSEPKTVENTKNAEHSKANADFFRMFFYSLFIVFIVLALPLVLSNRF